MYPCPQEAGKIEDCSCRRSDQIDGDALESSDGRGCSCMIAQKRPWPIELLIVRKLPVSEAIERVRNILGLRHRNLVGLYERTPSKSFFG